MEKHDAEHGETMSNEMKPSMLALELQQNLEAGVDTPSGLQGLTPEEVALNRRVSLKMDLSMLPLLSLLYLFNGLDKSNVGNAQTQGMYYSRYQKRLLMMTDQFIQVSCTILAPCRLTSTTRHLCSSLPSLSSSQFRPL